MLRILSFNAALTSADIFSFMSFPGNDEQKNDVLGMPVPVRKSTSISAIALSVDRWLIKTTIFCAATIFFSSNAISCSRYVRAELLRLTIYGILSAHFAEIYPNEMSSLTIPSSTSRSLCVIPSYFACKTCDALSAWTNSSNSFSELEGSLLNIIVTLSHHTNNFTTAIFTRFQRTVQRRSAVSQ